MGVCTEPEESQLLATGPATWGMGFIGEMSKDQLISEIVTAECVRLQDFELDNLKRIVIMLRMQGVHKRLLSEAHLAYDDDGPEGWFS